MSVQEVITVIIAATGCIPTLFFAWQARQSVRRIEEGRPRPASRRELDRIARKRGL